MKIHGWEPIIPQLAAYFVVREYEADPLSPFNLFLVGEPGTNKTGGLLDIAKTLDVSMSHIDASTLDDIAELAGIVDLGANRNRSEARMIKGTLLSSKILFLDEFLRTRGHVMQQLCLLLQGKLTLLGKEFEEMETESIVAAGNLSANLQEGQALTLDSAIADRYAMVLDVPPLYQMSNDDANGILERREGVAFEAAFKAAMAAIESNFEGVAKRHKLQIRNYVRILCQQLGKPEETASTAKGNDYDRKKKMFSFNGRRGQILMQFVTAAIALCKGQPERDLKETIWQCVRDCLSYHRLSGFDLDMTLLKSKHEEVYQLSFSDNPIESMIAAEPTLAGKLSLMVDYLAEISPITKADLMRMVIESDNTAVQLAVIDMVQSPVFAKEPADLRGMIARLDLGKRATPFNAGTEHLLAISQMSQAESLAYGLSGGDQKKTRAIMAEVNTHLVRWGVRKSAAQPETACA